jgi:hypothetical protein
LGLRMRTTNFLEATLFSLPMRTLTILRSVDRLHLCL